MADAASRTASRQAELTITRAYISFRPALVSRFGPRSHDQSVDLLSNFAFVLHKLRVGLLEGVFDDYDMFRREAPEKWVRRVEVWSAFFRQKAHILRRGNEDCPAHKILLQLAVEHADGSPLTVGAEQWLALGRCDWFWLRRSARPSHLQKDPCLGVLEGHGGSTVAGVLELASGRLLSWSDDGTLLLWDGQRGVCLAAMGARTNMMAAGAGAAELKNGGILSWLSGHTLRVWDGTSGGLSLVLEGHTSFVWGATVLSDGRVLSWSGDKTLRLWDYRSGAFCRASHDC